MQSSVPGRIHRVQIPRLILKPLWELRANLAILLDEPVMGMLAFLGEAALPEPFAGGPPSMRASLECERAAGSTASKRTEHGVCADAFPIHAMPVSTI